MTKNLRYFFLLLLVIGIVCFISCKKKTPENIGLPYLPSGDLLNANFTDTFTLITHTCKGDSLPTRGVTPSLLGTINDPLFGITAASIFAQFEPARYSPSFGTGIKIDSAVLALSYYGPTKHYGPLSTVQFKAYELSDTMNIITNYYSNTNKPYSALLGSAYIKPDVADSVLVGGVKLPPQIRLKLDTNFFRKFLDTVSTDYTTFSTFQNSLKGLYITTSGAGSILYIDLTHTQDSHITLYYRNNLHPTTDTTFNFNVNPGSCAHFSHFDHDYSTFGASDINYQVNVYKDTMIQEDHVYVQPMAGVRTKITFPYIKHFLDNGSKAINKAELILKLDPSSIAGANSIYVPHPQLVATIADALGPLIMPDYYEGGAYFGGVYDSTNHEYRFNIARYVQQVVTGKRKNEGLYILSTSSNTMANRVQLIGGSKTLSGRMRLKITYSAVK